MSGLRQPSHFDAFTLASATDLQPAGGYLPLPVLLSRCHAIVPNPGCQGERHTCNVAESVTGMDLMFQPCHEAAADQLAFRLSVAWPQRQQVQFCDDVAMQHLTSSAVDAEYESSKTKNKRLLGATTRAFAPISSHALECSLGRESECLPCQSVRHLKSFPDLCCVTKVEKIVCLQGLPRAAASSPGPSLYVRAAL